MRRALVLLVVLAGCPPEPLEGGAFVELGGACADGDECLVGLCFPALGPCVTGAAPPSCDSDGVCDPETTVCLEDECRVAECAPFCDDDAACAEGSTCYGEPRACRPARCAEGEHACADDQVCDPSLTADVNGCRTARCDTDDFACALGRCDPESAAADIHGCAVDACEADADCTTGRCASGTCRPLATGTCLEEAPPPPP